MKCSDCGELVEDRFIALHKKQFCQSNAYFSFRDFFKYRPFRYVFTGLVIWTTLWFVLWINGI